MVNITIPPNERLNFFVYIVESPSAPDLYHKRYEGDALLSTLSLDQIPCTHRIAISDEAFRASFLIGLMNELPIYKDSLPIVHISAHGSTEGIILSNNDIISWQTLEEILSPINKALNGKLLICMSSCEGFSACKMAMTKEEKGLPFYAIVGNSSKPTWSDTAIAYAAFYHLIKKGCTMKNAVSAMREASGDANFIFITGEKAKNTFLEIAKQKETPSLISALEAEINKSTSK